jgi:perosamine synthetase
MRRRAFREIPPTAGLPLRLADLLPQRPALGETLAAQLGTPPLQLECSGTAALLVALRTLSELAPDRRTVVVPAYTCPLVAIAVRSLGLELRLCDSRAQHFDMDPRALSEACDSDTLAVIPTHLAGLVADVDSAKEVARRVGAWVIEDAAQALGARAHGRSVGLCGDIGFFSLAAGKGLSIYEGGLLLTRDAALRDALRRTHQAMVPSRPIWELRRSLELLGLAALYRPSALGVAYGRPLRSALRRGDPVAAVGDDFPPTIPLQRVGRWREGVGTSAAARLPAFIEKLRSQATRRVDRLRQIREVKVFEPRTDTEGSWPFLLLRVPDMHRRDAILAPLWTAGVGVSQLFVHALPDYSYLADRVPQTPMPNASSFAVQTLTISNSPWLDDETFEGICAVIEQQMK